MAIFGTLSYNNMAPLLLCWFDVVSFRFTSSLRGFQEKPHLLCFTTLFILLLLLPFSCIIFSLSKDSLRASWECESVVCGKYLCGSIAYFLSDLEIHQSLGLSSQNGSRFRMHDNCICLKRFMAFLVVLDINHTFQKFCGTIL